MESSIIGTLSEIFAFSNYDASPYGLFVKLLFSQLYQICDFPSFSSFLCPAMHQVSIGLGIVIAVVKMLVMSRCPFYC